MVQEPNIWSKIGTNQCSTNSKLSTKKFHRKSYAKTYCLAYSVDQILCKLKKPHAQCYSRSCLKLCWNRVFLLQKHNHLSKAEEKRKIILQSKSIRSQEMSSANSRKQEKATKFIIGVKLQRIMPKCSYVSSILNGRGGARVSRISILSHSSIDFYSLSYPPTLF